MRHFKKKLACAALAAAFTFTAVGPFGRAASEYIESYGYDEYPDIVSVELPLNLDFTIDPFQIEGRGQIYSDEYVAQNLGPTDVVFDITGVELVYADHGGIEPLDEPFDEEWQTGSKAIYMEMGFDRDYLSPVVITDTNGAHYVSAVLNAPDGDWDEESRLTFSFTGSVNATPDSEWRRGDVSIMLTYSIEALPPELTDEPTAEPTPGPTVEPTEEPKAEPTEEPTVEPTEEPTAEPTEEPTAEPTEEPTAEPTEEPTVEPTEEPSVEEPTVEPAEEPAEETPSEPGDEPLPEPAKD